MGRRGPLSAEHRAKLAAHWTPERRAEHAAKVSAGAKASVELDRQRSAEGQARKAAYEAEAEHQAEEAFERLRPFVRETHEYGGPLNLGEIGFLWSMIQARREELLEQSPDEFELESWRDQLGTCRLALFLQLTAALKAAFPEAFGDDGSVVPFPAAWRPGPWRR